MRKSMIGWAAITATGLFAVAPALGATAPAQVMIVGTWHFDNPGRDINNVVADDVLTPARQKELEALAEALAAWKPTKVMVERQVTVPQLVDPGYTGFGPQALMRDRNEIVQIGYRLASRLKLPAVYAIDEQGDEGEPDYFPFGAVIAYAVKHGMKERLDAMLEVPAKDTRRLEALQKTATIPELLIDTNRPDGLNGTIGGYYGLLAIGDAAAQPGADLNAMWYLRNAKIFAKLQTVAQPGDRIVVIYGAGHNYWLKHFARETPGFREADAMPYLQRAAALARPGRAEN